MEIINGDIFTCKEEIIVHQTNCMGVIGSGLAALVKKKYPDVFKGYYHFCRFQEYHTGKQEDGQGREKLYSDRCTPGCYRHK